MGPEDFGKIVKEAGSFDKPELLENLLKEYPFCQPARLAYVKSLQNVEHENFKSELKKAAAYSGAREKLWNLIENNEDVTSTSDFSGITGEITPIERTEEDQYDSSIKDQLSDDAQAPSNLKVVQKQHLESDENRPEVVNLISDKKVETEPLQENPAEENELVPEQIPSAQAKETIKEPVADLEEPVEQELTLDPAEEEKDAAFTEPVDMTSDEIGLDLPDEEFKAEKTTLKENNSSGSPSYMDAAGDEIPDDFDGLFEEESEFESKRSKEEKVGFLGKLFGPKKSKVKPEEGEDPESLIEKDAEISQPVLSKKEKRALAAEDDDFGDLIESSEYEQTDSSEEDNLEIQDDEDEDDFLASLDEKLDSVDDELAKPTSFLAGLGNIFGSRKKTSDSAEEELDDDLEGILDDEIPKSNSTPEGLDAGEVPDAMDLDLPAETLPKHDDSETDEWISILDAGKKEEESPEIETESADDILEEPADDAAPIEPTETSKKAGLGGIGLSLGMLSTLGTSKEGEEQETPNEPADSIEKDSKTESPSDLPSESNHQIASAARIEEIKQKFLAKQSQEQEQEVDLNKEPETESLETSESAIETEAQVTDEASIEEEEESVEAKDTASVKFAFEPEAVEEDTTEVEAELGLEPRDGEVEEGPDLGSIFTSKTANLPTEEPVEAEAEIEAEIQAVEVAEEEEDTVEVETITSDDEQIETPDEIVTPAAEKAFETEGTHNFSDWLKLTSAQPVQREAPEISNEVDASEPRPVKDLEQAAIIDNFIAKDPRITPIKPKRDASEEKPVPTNFARRSVQEETAMSTETLAALYVDQGHYKKAIQAYRLLRLKNPEKSDFFADQISTLEKKLNS